MHVVLLATDLVNAQKGEVSGVVDTDAGLHIVMRTG